MTTAAHPRRATVRDNSATLRLVSRTRRGLGAWFDRRRGALAAKAPAVLGFLLDLTGLGLLSAAAWVIAVPAGLAASGVACLILAQRTD